MRNAASLTGVWSGRYTYPRQLAPVAFVATLIETASRFSGSTHEPDGSVGASGATAYAMIDGTRRGSSVSFTKTYDNVDPPNTAPIAYTGTLNADATEISGHWDIPGVWSGDFVMIRAPGKTVARKRTAFAPT